MKKIKSKIMLPIFIMATVFIVFLCIQMSMIFLNLQKIKQMEEMHFATAMKSSELKLYVVQVQQWLTDISATRGSKGFDDGFDEAEIYAEKVREVIAELKVTNPDNTAVLDEIEQSFEPYYKAGKRMAKAYIDFGPEGGNKMMGDFDGAAQTINQQIDLFVESSKQAISLAISEIENSIIASIILAVLAAVITILIAIFIQGMLGKSVVKPINEIRTAAQNLSHGRLDAQISFTSNDEVGQMANDLRQTIFVLSTYISEITHCTDELGNGNLAVKSNIDFTGDFIAIQESLNKLSLSLEETMHQIHLSSQQVAVSSSQVSDGAQALSEGAAEQASSLAQLSEAVESISQKTIKNATDAKNANLRTSEVGEETETSNEKMAQMLTAMEEISRCSDEISKIIKTIEDIAFQTNILALNAAVEAARAGAAGKGFAVVADEVRNLAQKSAEASKNTSSLIARTLDAVENGQSIANETSLSLQKVVAGVSTVAKTIHEISVSSSEQSQAVELVSQGIEQISGVVQTNSATAEQSAAASEELSQQSKLLNDMIEKFKLSDNYNV